MRPGAPSLKNSLVNSRRRDGLMHRSKRPATVAMIYSITSSARASSVAGTVMPSDSLGLHSIFVPETFRGRREETDSDRAGLKRHLRVRVLYAQPRSRVSVNPGRFQLAIRARKESPA